MKNSYDEILHNRIARRIIDQSGSTSFANFMRWALYSPKFGYYMRRRDAMGIKGDFITAPEIGSIFANCLARNLVPSLRSLAKPVLVEAGPGSGALICSLLHKLNEENALPKKVILVEPAPARHRPLLALIHNQFKTLLDNETFTLSIERKFPFALDDAVIIANEVLDAIPVHLVLVGRRHGKQVVLDQGVSLKDNEFSWDQNHHSTENDQRLNDTFMQISGQIRVALPDGYRTELAPDRQAWVAESLARINKGTWWFIDYGYNEREYYHPDRHMGTLVGYAQHKHVQNILANVGQQDISAHVDFTAIANTVRDCGWNIDGFCSQSEFLISSGILEEVQSSVAGARTANNSENGDSTASIDPSISPILKKLLLPGQMGEAIKVLAISKNMTVSDFPAFSGANRIESLNL